MGPLHDRTGVLGSSRVVGLSRIPMRITQCNGEVLVALDGREASRLMDACAMVVLAAESVPEVRLPQDLAVLLSDLFEGLKTSADHPQGACNPMQGS
jgi:hypothetical protein